MFGAVYAVAVLTSGDEDLLDALIRLAWLVVLPVLLVVARVIDPQQLAAARRSLTTRDRLATSR